MEKYTEEQLKDVATRSGEFEKELIELQTKYGMELYPIPVYAPTQDGSFITVVQLKLGDTKFRPVLSPIQNVIKEK
jgi:hypothetical protein